MRDLKKAFRRFNGDQQEAVRHDGNIVVLAGPGSGKTDTLVVKVAHLLASVVPAPRGVACITFNNDAVDEFRRRLADFGLYAGSRLYLGSVHSFCLNCIIRPYGALVDDTLGSGVRVASERTAGALLERIASRRIPNLYMPSYGPTITKLRRARACDEDLSGFDDRDVAVVEEYEATLARDGLVDFEAMVLRSVAITRQHRWIRRLLVARFPWLVVDEYQDLGGPLHKIVLSLAEEGTKVFAVGDPDQTVYDFTGADPKYLNELTQRADFHEVRLRFNYRSGGDLIKASQAALAPEGGPRPYLPDPNREDVGRVEFRQATNSVTGHADTAVAAVQEALADGTPPHEISVLYRQRNELLPELRAAFEKAGVPYVDERDGTYPRSPLVRWLQRAAGWALSPPDEREYLFSGLARTYLALWNESFGGESSAIELKLRTEFYSLLQDTREDMPLAEWLGAGIDRLGIVKALAKTRARSGDDLDAIQELLSGSTKGEYRTHLVRDFAADGRVHGKVILTTLHGSKGRQFDVVVLSGLVEGITPRWVWNRRRGEMEPLAGKALQEARRLFYVGFTRARHVVCLVYSKGFRGAKGHYNEWGISRFAIEIAKRLRSDGK